MIRSLNTGVLGIKQFQTSLDAIGNNLANVNTIGFKAARVDFSDTLSQTLRAPTPDTGTVSGSSGMQLGNGMQVSAIKNQFTQGAIKQTGVRTDLAITGEGFFLVKDPTTSELYATRAGDFREDKNGYLVTNDGHRVQGLHKQAPAYSESEKTEIGDLRVDVGYYMSDRSGVQLDYSSNRFTLNGHGYLTGNQVKFLGAVPTVAVGNNTNSSVYFVKSIDVNNFTLHATASDAASGANAVNFVNPIASSTGPIEQRDTITITAGNHAGDTFTVTANGKTTAPINSVPSISKISQVVIWAQNGASAGAEYSVEITTPPGGPKYTVKEGVDFIASGGDDTALIRNALVAKINADPDAIITAAASPDWENPNDALRLTGKIPGQDFYAHLTENDPKAGNSVSCHPLVDAVDNSGPTANAISAAINGLEGVSSTVSGNVITVIASGDSTALEGETRVLLGNLDGGNAVPAPTIATISNTNGTNVLIKSGHSLATGDTAYLRQGTGAIPGGLIEGKSYYVNVAADGLGSSVSFHNSSSDAIAGTNPVLLTSTGSDYQLYKDSGISTDLALTLGGGASITSYNVGADGKINMLLTDGTQYVRGQVLLQKFTNPQALLKQGSNLFGNLATAGPIGVSGLSASATDILKNSKAPGSSGVGRVAAGSLELANVDMAREFSNMITTQRAFQANARVVTTSDEVLREMMALKR